MKKTGPNYLRPSRDRPDKCPIHARFGRVQGRVISSFFWAEILSVLIVSCFRDHFLMNPDENNWPEPVPAESGSARRMPDLCLIWSGSGSGHLNMFLGWNPFFVNCFSCIQHHF